ncbi:hypothetical protein PV326_013518 [Microctonus aethiopoides]|nr:hypothetical protein PV326_013518 [Microctonus aethiopoides]
MVDPVKYYTPIIIHQCIGATIAISSIIATDSTYSVYAHHACGMFAAVSLSITGVQTTLNLNHPSEALQAGVLCFGHFVHIYYYSWNSQKILDHSSTIFDAAYNTEWYTVLDKRTNLVSFMMLRSTKPCVQTAGKVFPMTLMNFTVIVKTSMSYFTVLSNSR